MKQLSNNQVIQLFHNRVNHHDIELSLYGNDKNGCYNFIVSRHEDYDLLYNLEKIFRHSDRIEQNISDIVNIGFDDEYITCSDCGQVIKTTPDFYGDYPDYWIDDNGVQCEQCTRNNPDCYFEHLKNNAAAANVFFNDSELLEYGFIRINADDYESGLYPGQNDNPRKIFDQLKDKHDYIIFSITDIGQFDIHFAVYYRKSE